MQKLVFLIMLLMMSGCASTPGPATEGDPFESYNRAMFSFNESVDRTLFKPVSEAYKETMPKPVRKSVGNFFSNIDDAFVVVNDVLQLKIGQALMDFSRLVWNSTIGIAGLFDVASHMELPKHKEDFGQTLGYWGVGEGPYLILPFFGPSTLRDTTGMVIESPYHPVNQIEDPETYWAVVALMAVDARAELLSATKILDEAALDRYTFLRDSYLQHRRNLVYDGNPPRDPALDKKQNAPTKDDLELELELEQELQSAPAQ